MALVNENYLRNSGLHCFEEAEKRVNAYKLLHPSVKLFCLDNPNRSLQLIPEIVQTLHKTIDDTINPEIFRKDSSIRGCDFLIDKILKEYRAIGVSLNKESVFINDGSNSDIENIGYVLGRDNIIAITDPVHPLYENAAILSGRGSAIGGDSEWSNIIRIKCSEENGFLPQLPREKADILFISNPGNVTGTVLNRTELKKWVDYATKNKSLIVYDASYKAYIKEGDVPKSIYEIRGAKKVAVEIHSFSSIFGSSAFHCGYSVFPSELQVYTELGDEVSLNKLWTKRVVSFTNGSSYVMQRAAEAIFSRKGKSEIAELVNYYSINASLIREELLSFGWKVYGGVNSPYIWFKIPVDLPSWKYFTQLLYEAHIVSIPGIAFGDSNDGYMGFSAFGDRTDIINALKKLKSTQSSNF
ncbi:MAG: LL-diaminopimelate aminotransferase [Prevotellaceae bacterium]|jgi:LL-diaminopimelate aminotransferase|nr:LL-diaminopimelate aminotransferase [Prevotellaceae bacterium]